MSARILDARGWEEFPRAIPCADSADRDCVRSTSRCAPALSPRLGTSPAPLQCLTVLRLVLGGHSRAPQRHGPRSESLGNTPSRPAAFIVACPGPAGRV